MARVIPANVELGAAIGGTVGDVGLVCGCG